MLVQEQHVVNQCRQSMSFLIKMRITNSKLIILNSYQTSKQTQIHKRASIIKDQIKFIFQPVIKLNQNQIHVGSGNQKF